MPSKPAHTNHREMIKSLEEQVLEGLSSKQKFLPPSLLYDKKGSELFCEICSQPEYTIARSEIDILSKNAQEIAQLITEKPHLIEFGAGTIQKIIYLIKVCKSPCYTAIDISGEYLNTSIKNLQNVFQSLPVQSLCADYNQPLKLSQPNGFDCCSNVGCFFGSSIGNFSPEEAVNFLLHARSILGKGSFLLVGVDQPREQKLLELAYNDEAGISARFALNALQVLVSDMQSNIDLKGFQYKAYWDNAESRIVMSLVSKKTQYAEICAKEFKFLRDEQIITEYSYKYSQAKFKSLISEAGWYSLQHWCDNKNHYCLYLLKQQADT